MAWVPRVLSSAPWGLPCCLQLQSLCRVLTWGVRVACKQCSLSRCNILCKMTCFSLVLNHRTKHKVLCAALSWVKHGHLAFGLHNTKEKHKVFSNCGQLTMSACADCLYTRLSQWIMSQWTETWKLLFTKDGIMEWHWVNQWMSGV